MKELVREVLITTKYLKEWLPKLTQIELVQLSIELHKLKTANEANELFKTANAISSSNLYPPALEAIAIQLGFKKEFEAETILKVLQRTNQ